LAMVTEANLKDKKKNLLVEAVLICVSCMEAVWANTEGGGRIFRLFMHRELTEWCINVQR